MVQKRKTELELALSIVNKRCGSSLTFDWAFGGVRIESDGGSATVSPRLSGKEMALYLDGMLKGLDLKDYQRSSGVMVKSLSVEEIASTLDHTGKSAATVAKGPVVNNYTYRFSNKSDQSEFAGRALFIDGVRGSYTSIEDFVVRLEWENKLTTSKAILDLLKTCNGDVLGMVTA